MRTFEVFTMFGKSEETKEHKRKSEMGGRTVWREGINAPSLSLEATESESESESEDEDDFFFCEPT